MSWSHYIGPRLSWVRWEGRRQRAGVDLWIGNQASRIYCKAGHISTFSGRWWRVELRLFVFGLYCWVKR